MTERSTHPPLVLGLDLGATNMQIGVVDDKNTIISRIAQRTEGDGGPDHVIQNIVKGVNAACAKAHIAISDLHAVGICHAGAIDIPRGIILQSPNLKWKDIPLRDRVSEALQVPVVLDNDVNGAVWGEYCAGIDRETDHLLGVWIGTGIGGGLIINRKLYHGPFFTAGEIGYTVIFPEEEEYLRILERWGSRTGMKRNIEQQWNDYPDSTLRQLTSNQPEKIATEHLSQAYQEHDPLACRVIDQAADLLGTSIANWVTVLALDRVVIGGGMTEVLGEPFLQHIRNSFDRAVFPDRVRVCKLLPTTLAADAGLLGAAALAHG